MQKYQILKCQNCGLRFPLTNSVMSDHLHCVSCGAEVESLCFYQNYYQQDKPVFEKKLKSLVFVLDNIRSAWNVGSMFRSSDASGVEKLFLCGISPTPENAKVLKTSLGAEKKVAWEYAKDGFELIKVLKKDGYKLIAMEKTANSQSLFNFSGKSLINEKVAVVLGHEVGGVDPDILDYVDQVLHLPMLGVKNSLNVASVFSIVAYFMQYCLLKK